MSILGFIFGGIALSAVIGFGLGVYFLSVIPLGRMFQKAGVESWRAYIPVYNGYIYAKLVWNENAFWVMLVLGIISGAIDKVFGDGNFLLKLVDAGVSIALLVYQAKLALRASRAYGHDVGYAVGLFFVPTIFWYVIGFGNSEYIAPQNY